MYAPRSWSEFANSEFYPVAGFVLQTAQTHNVTIPGDHKYNVPSGNFTDQIQTLFSQDGFASTSNLTSYSILAIAGADDFRDNNTETKLIFDDIIENTRDITPTCEFPTTRSYLFILIDYVPESSRNCFTRCVSVGGSNFS